MRLFPTLLNHQHEHDEEKIMERKGGTVRLRCLWLSRALVSTRQNDVQQWETAAGGLEEIRRKSLIGNVW